MDNLSIKHSRRDFLKHSLAASSLFALSNSINGCTAIPYVADTIIQFDDLEFPDINCQDGIYIKNCNIIDVNKGKVIKGESIKVLNNRIYSIGKQYDHINDRGLLELDLQGAYIIPGLIDSHCHITFPCTYGFNILDLLIYFRQMKKNYNQHIYSGVTTVRDMGAFPLILRYFKESLQKNLIVGPRLIYCNRFTNIYRSHPDIAPPDMTKWAVIDDLIVGDQSLWFHDMNELIDGIEENIRTGASFIKITLDDDSLLCGGGKIPTYSDEHLKTIFNYAQRYNLPVAAHALRKFGFDRAVKWGVNSIEHTIGDAYHSDYDIDMLVKKNISINPTLLVGQMYAVEEAYNYIPDEYRDNFLDEVLISRRDFIYTPQNRYIELKIHENNRKYLDYLKTQRCEDLFKKKIFVANPELFFGVLKYAQYNIRKMKEAGVNIGCGTDAGMPYILHGLVWKEMELLSKVGLSLAEVLKCATINNAKILNMEDQIGSIEKNKLADLVVLDNNPLKNIATYRTPSVVIKDGKIIYLRNAIKKDGHIKNGLTI